VAPHTQGLWRGTVPGLLLTMPYTAVQFVALQQVRQAAASVGLTANPGLSPLVSLGSGAVAGAAATVASYPFDLLRTTLAAQGEPKVSPATLCGAVHGGRA
jgi:solute carrier family 25 thiamine pyrophosphate transporter 19